MVRYLKNVFTSKDEEYAQIRAELKQAIGLILFGVILAIFLAFEMGRELLKIFACVIVVLLIGLLLFCTHICLQSVWKHYKAYKAGSVRESRDDSADSEAPYFVEPLRERGPMVYYWDASALMRNSTTLYNCSLMGEFDKKLFGFTNEDQILTSEEAIHAFRVLDGDKKSPAYEVYIEYIRRNLGLLPPKEDKKTQLDSGDGYWMLPTTVKEFVVARLIEYRQRENVEVAIVTEDSELTEIARINGFVTMEHVK